MVCMATGLLAHACNLHVYTNYLFSFFVVEDHILHTAPNLINRQFMDDLWEMTISKLVSVMRSDSVSFKMRLHLRSCNREVCLFYYVQIAIGDFYDAQLGANLCVCARTIRSALRRNRCKSDLRFQLRVTQ